VYGGNIENFGDFVRSTVAQHAAKYGEKVIRSLAHNHGTEYQTVLRTELAAPELFGTIGGSSTLRSEVIHAVREEMAQTLSDIIFRRTDLGTGGHPGHTELKECALLVAEELGWDSERVHREMQDVESRFPGGNRT